MTENGDSCQSRKKRQKDTEKLNKRPIPTLENQQTFDFGALNYTDTYFVVPKSLKRSIKQEIRGHSSKYDALPFTNGRITAKKVRYAGALAGITAIQTDAGRLDDLLQEVAGSADFRTLKEEVTNTTDGTAKWDFVREMWTDPDLPAEVAEHARDGRWIEAQATLAGLKENAGREATYLRTTKANWVTSLLGDPHSLCLDSRRRDVLGELLQRALPGDAREPHHYQSQYRQQGAPAGTKSKQAHSQVFLEESLARSPKEYRTITKTILDKLETETGHDRHSIKHALFNIGGSRTFHPTLQEKLGE